MKPAFRLSLRAALGAIVPALSLGFSAPILAQAAGADYAAMSREDLAAAVAQDLTNPRRDPCNSGVSLWTYISENVPEKPDGPALLAISKSLCATQNGKFTRALDFLDEAEELGQPVDSVIAVWLTVQAKDSERFIYRLRRLALDTDQSLGDGQDGVLRDLIFSFANGEGLGDHITQLGFDAFQQGKLDQFDPQLAEAFAYRTLDGFIESKPDQLEGLAGYILDRRTLVFMMASRKFEPVWAELESHVGAEFSLITPHEVAATKAAFLGDSTNENVQSYIAALRADGQHEEAVTVLRAWRGRSDAPSGIDGRLAWAMNGAGFSLDLLGRPAEGDAIFDELAALDPASHLFLVNFLINKAGRMIAQERWAEGIEAYEPARKVIEQTGSPYAKSLMARDLACAYQALGQGGKAKKEMRWLRKNAETYYAEITAAMMCLGERARAAKILLKQMDDEDRQPVLASDLQHPRFTFEYAKSALPTPYELIDEFPELRVKFLTFARAVPEEFWPRATLGK